MLHPETVTGAALGLLKDLMDRPELAQFAIVGGTNLALRIGHRKSIDLDLFTSEPFNPEFLAAALPAVFPNTEVVSVGGGMLFLYIADRAIRFIYCVHWSIFQMRKIRETLTPCRRLPGNR